MRRNRKDTDYEAVFISQRMVQDSASWQVQGQEDRGCLDRGAVVAVRSLSAQTSASLWNVEDLTLLELKFINNWHIESNSIESPSFWYLSWDIDVLWSFRSSVLFVSGGSLIWASLRFESCRPACSSRLRPPSVLDTQWNCTGQTKGFGTAHDRPG